ncbi:hypothetical protein HPB47_001856 [Ixodes persulcatus]|uniref:Uncharacterized protein n=1 Tax=Ixodes persulcatus TaxID=34615 RepID=A0AC60PPE1_IXOPE|nr:hypothetical protein HPB47_001856 [Ixodes persulcatus]
MGVIVSGHQAALDENPTDASIAYSVALVARRCTICATTATRSSFSVFVWLEWDEATTMTFGCSEEIAAAIADLLSSCRDEERSHNADYNNQGHLINRWDVVLRRADALSYFLPANDANFINAVRLRYCATEAHSWARGGASASAAAMTSLLWNAQTGEARVVAAEPAAAAAPAHHLCAV